jgi:S-adenosylmethionine:tRNA ribosyltransferase-isomerase
MRLSELQYELPPELIAQHPVVPRDASRLLVLDRRRGSIEHRTFRDLGDYLVPGDCLVLNDTRVIPARFFGRRATGGRVEGLFLRTDGDGWRVMLKGSARLKVGERIACDRSPVQLTVERRLERGEWLVRPEPAVGPLEWLVQVGHTPLPPYIHRGASTHGLPGPEDAERYQTVYAQRPGAVAAPTAGLHFTAELLDQLRGRGVRQVDVTLHVGPGTFVPIEVDDLSEHRMHAEWFEVTPAALVGLRAARTAGRRVVAVGTTSARVLESLSAGELDRPAATTAAPGDDSAVPRLLPGKKGDSETAALSGWTDIFIHPPYRFRHVDRLLTNFHLPGSTLLALVMAFASPELIRAAYREAVERRYRFYSYGDAMLIL